MKKLTFAFVFVLLLLATVCVFAQARVQVIHNASDPVADTVDVYINGALTLDNFAFRTASNFVTLPSGVAVSIAVGPGNSTSVGDAVATFSYDSLEAGKTYIIVANGVIGSGFTANPDGESIGFNLYLNDMGRESAAAGNVDLLIFHGATDAPTVDIVARGIGTIADDLSYGDFGAGYVTVPAGKYIIDVYTADQSTLVTSYTVNLTTAGGAAAVAFASGFLDPSQGPAFGLLGATDIGSPTAAVFNFPALANARVQVIHNAADPAADTVDIYVLQDEVPVKLENVAFRSATAYLNVAAGVPIRIGIAGAGSSSFADTIATFNYDSLATGGTYVVIANGVLAPASFTANPSGNNIGFNLFVNAGQEEASNGSSVALAVFHGATDAPEVDVASGGTALIPGLEYGDFQAYTELPATSYVLDINLAGTTTTVASYTADITTLGGGAAVAFASGFLDGAQGDGFGIWATLADGTTFELPLATGIAETALARNLNLYPNPAVNSSRLDFTLETANDVQVRLVNSLGQVQTSTDLGKLDAGANQVTINLSGISPGVYLIQMVIGNQSTISRSIVVQ